MAVVLPTLLEFYLVYTSILAFVTFCPDCGEQELRRSSEIIKRRIEELDLPFIESPFQRVTLSFGLACAAGKPAETVFGMADSALYLSKANGRNCIKYVSKPERYPLG